MKKELEFGIETLFTGYLMLTELSETREEEDQKLTAFAGLMSINIKRLTELYPQEELANATIEFSQKLKNNRNLAEHYERFVESIVEALNHERPDN